MSSLSPFSQGDEEKGSEGCQEQDEKKEGKVILDGRWPRGKVARLGLAFAA